MDDKKQDNWAKSTLCQWCNKPVKLIHGMPKDGIVFCSPECELERAREINLR